MEKEDRANVPTPAEPDRMDLPGQDKPTSDTGAQDTDSDYTYKDWASI